MTLVRWSPSVSRDLGNIHDEMNRLFDGFLTRIPLSSDTPTFFTPAVDLAETPEEFILCMDLPGVVQKDVKVSLMGDTLTIRGERKVVSDPKSSGLHRRERIHGTFERSFTLGTPVRADRVQATYRDGVLEIRVPKAEEARMREIEVQVS